MLSEHKTYLLETNGVNTGFLVSLKEALLTSNWDVVTIQQVSNEAPYYYTYQPYLNKIVEYIRLCVPKAKLAIHQTWAYEQDSSRLNVELGYKNSVDMFNDIQASYKKAANEIDADLIIPSGELFQKLIESGIEKIHRDTFHASLGLGRYALGLLWYSILSGNDVKNNTFCHFDEEISEKEIIVAKQCVTEICGI